MINWKIRRKSEGAVGKWSGLVFFGSVELWWTPAESVASRKISFKGWQKNLSKAFLCLEVSMIANSDHKPAKKELKQITSLRLAESRQIYAD